MTLWEFIGAFRPVFLDLTISCVVKNRMYTMASLWKCHVWDELQIHRVVFFQRLLCSLCIFLPCHLFAFVVLLASPCFTLNAFSLILLTLLALTVFLLVCPAFLYGRTEGVQVLGKAFVRFPCCTHPSVATTLLLGIVFFIMGRAPLNHVEVLINTAFWMCKGIPWWQILGQRSDFVPALCCFCLVRDTSCCLQLPSVCKGFTIAAMKLRACRCNVHQVLLAVQTSAELPVLELSTLRLEDGSQVLRQPRHVGAPSL
mmetsp:Transcript_17843/g.34759  ORF Transcript_17843/g.34759 Transcript_17843/m.34759 type:complete len:257 (+) Transcript_17843:962-1732(+)